MSSVVISGDTSGSITLAAPAAAGSTTITFPASTGTSVVNPLPSASLITASAGLIEYDGKVPYITPQGTQRGVIPGAQFFRLNADLAGANSTAVQNTYGVGVTLSSSTVYAFQGVYKLAKTAGTTSHTIAIGFGGTATLNNIGWTILYPTAPVITGNAASLSIYYYSAATISPFTSATTTAGVDWFLSFSGTVSVNAGGTFIPQYQLSAAPGGAYSTANGSYINIYPIGASGANTNVGTWA